MHQVTSPSSRSLVGFAIMSLVVALGCAGCSGRTRLARLLDQANRDFQAGKYDQAEIEYKNVLQLNPQNAPAIAGLGIIFHAEGREARSLPFLLKARELQPDNLAARLRLGLASLATGNAKDARAEALSLLARPPLADEVPLLLVEASISPKEVEEARQRLLALPAAAAQSAPVLVALGRIAQRQNRPKDAEASINAARAADAKSAAAASALGMLYWSQSNLKAADAAFKEAAEFSPPRSPRRLQYAQFKLQAGDLAGGRLLLEQISRETPDYLPVWVWLAELAGLEKKYDESEALLARALARDPLLPEAMLLAARVHLAKGATDQAVGELERLASLFPRSAQISFQLGLAYVAKGDLNQALPFLRQASPEIPRATIAIGELNFRRRDYGAALAVLKPFVRQYPGLVNARTLLAEVERASGDPDGAVALYAQLEKELPRDPQIPFSHGLALLQQNRWADARTEFIRTRELTPGHWGALEQLVALDLRDKNYAAARQLVAADLAQNPSSVPLILLLAKVHLAQGDIPAAEAELKHTIELQPDSPDAHFLLARLYLGSKQPQKALADLQGAVAKNPQNLPALLLLAVIQDQQKDYAAACGTYEKALGIDPKSSLAANNLAYLYAGRPGQLARAHELAQRARTLLPQEPRTADTLGWVLVQEKQYPQAIALLQESAARLPGEPEVQYHLGTACYLLGDEETARTAFQLALKTGDSFDGAGEARQRLATLNLDPARADPATRSALEQQLAQHPDDIVALMRLGESNLRHGEMSAALAHYQSVLLLNPRHAGAMIELARLTAATDQPKALALAKGAHALAPDDPAITHALGRIAFEGGDHRWSASLLDQAVRQRPDDPEFNYDWAVAAYSIGHVEDATAGMQRALAAGRAFARAKQAGQFLEMLSLAADPARAAAGVAQAEAALRSDPADVSALMVLATGSEQKPDAPAAKQTYERILKLYPDFAPAQRGLAILYAANPVDDRKAAALATQARQAYPTDPDLARALAMVAYRQGDFTKAANLLRETAARKSKDGELMYYLGMAQWRLNQTSEGRQSLHRALELGVNNQLAAEAKKLLAGLN